ncbi:MAG: hypothetical protein P8166_18120 [Candidatus Thiodiazotropha sp.]
MNRPNADSVTVVVKLTYKWLDRKSHGDISSNIEWYAQGAPIGTGASIIPNLAAGDHAIQVQVVDNHAKSALVELQVTVVFNNPPQLSVESPSQDIVTAQYLPIHLAANASDVESGDLSASISASPLPS